MAMTEKQERALALRRVTTERRRLKQAEVAFAEMVRAASGVAPQRAIADAAGLSVTRINQIIHGHSGN